MNGKRWEQNEDRLIRTIDLKANPTAWRPAPSRPTVLRVAAFNALFRAGAR